MCTVPGQPVFSRLRPLMTAALFLLLGSTIGAGLTRAKEEAQMNELLKTMKSKVPDVSITVFTPAFSCIPFPTYGEELCLLLERTGIRQVDLSESNFYPQIDAPFREVADSFESYIRLNPVETDYALFAEYVAPMAEDIHAIRTFLVDGKGNPVLMDERPTKRDDFVRVGVAGTDGAALLLVEYISEVLGLPDARRPQAPEGKWAARHAEKTGRPLGSETAPMEERVTTLRRVFKKSRLIIFPTMVDQRTDRQSALHLAEILNEGRLCSAEVAEAETLFELDMSGDATRMLWDLAKKFRGYAKKLNLDADYMLYTHYYFYQTSDGENAVGLVLYVLCDSDAEWVVVEWQSEQSADFVAVSPKTVSDCDRLVAERLEFHSTPQKVVGIGVSIREMTSAGSS